MPGRPCNLRGPQPEGVDQPAEAHVAHDRPAELNDLFFRVVAEEVVEQLVIDVVVVDKEPFRVRERRLLGLGEVLVAPRPDLRDRLLFQGLQSP